MVDDLIGSSIYMDPVQSETTSSLAAVHLFGSGFLLTLETYILLRLFAKSS